MKMIISVIIPSYNPQEYLFECLDSLCSQTISECMFEIIIVLNGCREPYMSEIKRYMDLSHRNNIKLIHTEIPGVSNARNIGMENADGDYLVFVDDDDMVSPSYLEKLLAESSDDCIGCSNSYSFVSNIDDKCPNFVSEAYLKCFGEKYSALRFRSFLSAPWGKMIHKQLIRDNKFAVNIIKSEDSVFFLGISPNVSDMKLTDSDAIYYHRLRPDSVMNKNRKFSVELWDHCLIEREYAKIWISRFFYINPFLVLTRMAACMKNLFFYIK